MTFARRTAHDRVRQQANDPDPRWPLRGDLAYDTTTSRTGVIVDIPEDTGTTVYRLVPEGGGEDDWTAWLDTLMPVEDVFLSHSPPSPGSAVQQESEYAPWDDTLDSPGPRRTRAEKAWSDSCGSPAPAARREEVPLWLHGGSGGDGLAQDRGEVAQFVGGWAETLPGSTQVAGRRDPSSSPA
ncbi:hypothetical protein [Streptomyces sp. NPDC047014]|uniref:hypothetical protein n=1 Tax=Streptomyces sp. NPDC047014 TaxID=3155736 RepID=UPI0033CBE030